MTSLHTEASTSKERPRRAPSNWEILSRVVEENPNLEDKKLFALFHQKLDKDRIRSIISDWFMRNLQICRLREQRADPDYQRQRREEVAATKEPAKARIAIALLDWMTPYGKQFRECTGRECARLSVKLGAWLKTIADNMKPHEKVGSVYSEEQLQRILRRKSK